VSSFLYWPHSPLSDGRKAQRVGVGLFLLTYVDHHPRREVHAAPQSTVDRPRLQPRLQPRAQLY
jgi:hypothetical protein